MPDNPAIAALAGLMPSANGQKLTHEFCRYRPAPPATNCGNCHHFTAPGCEIVQDPIQPGGLCDFHAPRAAAGPGLLGGASGARPVSA